MDTVIEPFVLDFQGSSVIGEQCTIGACSILDDATLGDGRRRWDNSHRLQPPELDDGAQVGPYAPAAHGPFHRSRRERTSGTLSN